MAIGDAPVRETIAELTAVSLARTELDARTLVLVRLAALVSVDAPTSAYLQHLQPALASGVTLEDVKDVLVAVAPIVGTARTASASDRIVDALGAAIVLDVENEQW